MKQKNIFPQETALFTPRQGITLGMLCAGLLIYKLYFFEIQVLSLPYYIGSDVGNAFGLWLVFILFFARKFNLKLFSLSFFLILMSGMTVTLGKYYEEKRSLQSSIVSIEQSYQKLILDPDQSDDPLTSARTSTAAIDSSEPSVFTNSRSDGTQANQLKIVSQYYEHLVGQMLAFQQNYEQALEKIGLDQIWDEEQLREHNAQTTYKTLFNSIEQILSKAKNEHSSLIKQALEEAQQLPLSPEFKRQFISGMRTSINRLKDEYELTWQLEEDALSTLEAGTSLLLSNPDAWDQSNGEFFFSDDALLVEFNEHMGQLMQIMDRQEAIREQSVGRMSEQLNELRHQYDGKGK